MDSNLQSQQNMIWKVREKTLAISSSLPNCILEKDQKSSRGTFQMQSCTDEDFEKF